MAGSSSDIQEKRQTERKIKDKKVENLKRKLNPSSVGSGGRHSKMVKIDDEVAEAAVVRVYIFF